MISPLKLKSLPKKTRHRKIALILQGMEEELRRGGEIEEEYLHQILLILSQDDLPAQLGSVALSSLNSLSQGDKEGLLWLCNRCRHALLGFYNIPQGDWDLLYPAQCRQEREIELGSLYLDEIRSPFNIGSIFRTAEAFGISRIYLSPGTASPKHPRALRTSMGCIERIPWEYKTLEQVPSGIPIFALETGGTGISLFSFPPKGMAVIGNEELGISPEARKLVSASYGIVSIPQTGTKGSLNLSVAFGILAYSWFKSLNPVL